MTPTRELPLPQCRETFSDLVAEHEPSLQRYCHKLCRDESLAADASQEAFLHLWRRILLGKKLDNPAAWLRKVASTRTTDLMRRRQTQGNALTILRKQAITNDNHHGIDRLIDAEVMASYEAGLLTLPDQQRRAFLLRHEGGMSLREIAVAMQLGLPTVKTHFARACLKLQASLHPEPRS